MSYSLSNKQEPNTWKLKTVYSPLHEWVRIAISPDSGQISTLFHAAVKLAFTINLAHIHDVQFLRRDKLHGHDKVTLVGEEGQRWLFLKKTDEMSENQFGEGN